jgi:hypothetical protein
VPSKKQRRRREKAFRHEYDYVLVDESGEEVPVDPAQLRAQREKDKPKPQPAKTVAAKKGRGSRPVRELPPPSWERAFRKGGLWGGIMLVAFVFLFKNGPLITRVGFGLFYAAAFVPLTYWIDRTAYRSYLKRSGKAVPPAPARKR